MTATTALLWYRRDLRLADHPALTRALAAFDRVVPVFVLDDALLHGRFGSSPRTAFMLGCLRALDAQLRRRGSGLVVRHGRPAQELVALAGEVGAQTVLWTSDVAPYARARDTEVTTALCEADVLALPQGGSYVVDVSQPRTQGGKPYTVFSPFHRHWLGLERRSLHRAPAQLPALPSALRKGRLPSLASLGVSGGHDVEPFCEPGEAAARQALARWLDGPVDRYDERHDALGVHATSELSPYLRWGCLSAAECEQRAASRASNGADAWVRQLCWRDFFAHALLMNPANARLEFQARYRDLEWEQDDESLAAWRDGQTGYPLVDAGMRQLARSGWMPRGLRPPTACGLPPGYGSSSVRF